jgi:hypothetical protein
MPNIEQEKKEKNEHFSFVSIKELTSKYAISCQLLPSFWFDNTVLIERKKKKTVIEYR